MVKNQISKTLALSFYVSLFFMVLGFVFLFFNGSNSPAHLTEINIRNVFFALFAGNPEGAFLSGAFVICFSPFLSVIVLIIYGIKNKNYIVALTAVCLIILLILSISL